MALKQQILPFQIRNPYRLDRPHFDPNDVWQATIAEEEEAQRSQLPQRPLPPQPVTGKQSTDASNGVKRVKEQQKKSSQSDSEKTDSRRKAASDGVQSESDNNHVQHPHYSYFNQSWFGQSLSQRISVAAPAKQQPTQLPVPTITISHHIDTHAELTFERHVEWLTQTALWWDMPVVHLYPAPESPVSLQYVETAASRFSSWVNFVKIPVGEESRLGVATLPTKSTHPGKTRGARAIKDARKEIPRDQVTVEDTHHGGGMVTDQARKPIGHKTSTSISSRTKEVEPVVGYVFVGSAEEQAQYHQVFETMERLFPMIEIRYINSFEPQHLQSRQQQELRDEPCLHSLSWIHYWSAAKESQVLQSKIVNEVVRVRPMWVNTDGLHRNYAPLQPLTPPSPPPTILECPVFSPSTSTIPTSPSVYIGGDKNDDQSLEESLKGIPSTVSIASLLDIDSTMDDCSLFDVLEDDRNVSFEKQDTLGHDALEQQESRSRSLFSRTQSSMDLRQDASDSSSKPTSRRFKRWGFTSMINGDKKDGCRRSTSTPLLLLTRDDTNHTANSGNMKNIENVDTTMDSCPNNDTNMSPPPLSPASLTSPSSTSSTSSTASSSPVSSLGLGPRLAGLAQRLGVYKMKGSSLMVVDL
ncbi:hypothetical protein EDD21DRAFT_433922 [Dissophora ornata]|nr:hypothetical protein BGZ58_003859 [Dissophora ornata]KAI8605071.1 hypothetical protein EDD21DRAFT_433922 [Dissophora ornata]